MKRQRRPDFEVLPRRDTPSLVAPATQTPTGVESEVSQLNFATDLNKANMLPVADSSGASTLTIGGVPVFQPISGGGLGVSAVSFYNVVVVPTVNAVIQANQLGNPPMAGGGGAAPQAGLAPVPAAWIVVSDPPINQLSDTLNAPVVETPVLTGPVPGPLVPTATIIPINTDIVIGVVPIYLNQQSISFTPPITSTTPVA